MDIIEYYGSVIFEIENGHAKIESVEGRNDGDYKSGGAPVIFDFRDNQVIVSRGEVQTVRRANFGRPGLPRHWNKPLVINACEFTIPYLSVAHRPIIEEMIRDQSSKLHHERWLNLTRIGLWGAKNELMERLERVKKAPDVPAARGPGIAANDTAQP